MVIVGRNCQPFDLFESINLLQQFPLPNSDTATQCPRYFRLGCSSVTALWKNCFGQPTLQNCKNCHVKQICWASWHLVLDNLLLLNYILFVGINPTTGNICPEFAIIVQIAKNVAPNFRNHSRFLFQQSFHWIQLWLIQEVLFEYLYQTRNIWGYKRRSSASLAFTRTWRSSYIGRFRTKPIRSPRHGFFQTGLFL